MYYQSRNSTSYDAATLPRILPSTRVEEIFLNRVVIPPRVVVVVAAAATAGLLFSSSGTGH